jgi:mono/diheme cytochrome c family protein
LKQFSYYSVLSLVSGLVLGCQKSPPPPPAPAATAEVEAPEAPVVVTPEAEARHIFDTRCVVCHGSVGKGDGPGGAALNPKPRAFADATWQKSVDDSHIAKIIVEGGPAVKLSAGMAANPDLADKPEVVAELVKIVRKFAQ